MYERVRSCAQTATRSDTLEYQDDTEQAGIRFNLILGTSQLKILVLTLQSRHFLAQHTVKEALELRSCLLNEGIYIYIFFFHQAAFIPGHTPPLSHHQTSQQSGH